VVIGALVLGGFYGGLGGALGLVIGDLLSGWAVYAPLTLVLKLGIGLVTGLIAHRFGKINEINDPKKRFTWTLAASAGGLLLNMILSPLANYFYNIWIIGKPAADVVFTWGIIASGINAGISLIVAVAVYLALWPALKKSGVLSAL
jgi:uncharacterized membrane protein